MSRSHEVIIQGGDQSSQEDYSNWQFKQLPSSANQHGMMLFLRPRIRIIAKKPITDYGVYSTERDMVKFIIPEGHPIRRELDRVRVGLGEALNNKNNNKIKGEFKRGTGGGEFIRLSRKLMNIDYPNSHLTGDDIPRNKHLMVAVEVYAVFVINDGFYLQTELVEFKAMFGGATISGLKRVYDEMERDGEEGTCSHQKMMNAVATSSVVSNTSGDTVVVGGGGGDGEGSAILTAFMQQQSAKCHFCGKEFYLDDSLQKHLETVHANIEPNELPQPRDWDNDVEDTMLTIATQAEASQQQQYEWRQCSECLEDFIDMGEYKRHFVGAHCSGL